MLLFELVDVYLWVDLYRCFDEGLFVWKIVMGIVVVVGDDVELFEWVM